MARTSARRSAGKSRNWSAAVAERSNALDIEGGIFACNNPRTIARSLKRSAEQSRRRKGTPYQSAMSMLTFYINRAGRGLPTTQRAILERTKMELRKAFGRGES